MMSPTAPPVLLAHIVYSFQSVRESGIPDIVPLSSIIRPDGKEGETSQVSI